MRKQTRTQSRLLTNSRPSVHNILIVGGSGSRKSFVLFNLTL